jgi:hypothetical protein
MKIILAAVAATFATVAALIDNYDQIVPRLQELERTRYHVVTLKNEARTVTKTLLQQQNLVPCGTLDGGERARVQSRGRYRDKARSYQHNASGAARSGCLRKFNPSSGPSTISSPQSSTPRAFLKRQARPAEKVTVAAGADTLRAVEDLGLTS